MLIRLLTSTTLLALAMAVGPTSAAAQTPTLITPTTGITFTASDDHASVDIAGNPVVLQYLVRFSGIGCPIYGAVNLGKPMPDAAATILIKPWPPLMLLPPNCAYTATVSAVGPTGVEGVSAPTDPFWRSVPKTPAAPGKPALR